MKREILIFTLVFVTSMAKAQTWVNSFSSTGNHQASKYTVGVRAESKSTNTSLQSGHSYGVWASAKNGQYNYGVYGTINSTGAAIYGSIYGNDTIQQYIHSPTNNRYAGYFDGMVQVIGNLNVIGFLYYDIPTGVDSFDPSSRALFLSPEALYRQLRGISVNAYKRDDGVYYAFSADNLEAVFPGMVHEIGLDKKGYDVHELVPILVKAINELSEKIEELEKKLYKEK